MWNNKRSIALSEAIVLIFIIVIAGIMLTAPQIVNCFVANNVISATIISYLLTTTYTGGSVIIIMLYLLYRLLKNIRIGDVFIKKNTYYLRLISWLCLLGSFIALVSAFYWIVWLPIAIAAGFFSILIRVIKNIIDEAIVIKIENDFTI